MNRNTRGGTGMSAKRARAGQPGTSAPDPGDTQAAQRARTAYEQLLTLFEGHRLSPTQRRIAQYLLSHLPDAAFLSSSALAEAAGVSQPSVTRFAVALGFSGFPELRVALHPIGIGAGSSDAARADGAGVARGNELQQAVAAEIRNLNVLHESLVDPGLLADLGAELAASVPLTVL